MKSETAQITIDYLAGVGIFLLTVAFVFQFIYGLFVPFQSGSDEATLSADRASTVLIERLVSADSSEGVNVVDQGKLYDFITTKLNYSNQTAYNNALKEIGLFSNDTLFDLNISVVNLSFQNNPMYRNGPQLSENIDIGQTKRLVMIVNSSTGYNETAFILVRVW